MTFVRNKIIVHLTTDALYVYRTVRCKLELLQKYTCETSNFALTEEDYSFIDESLEHLTSYTHAVDHENVRVYASGKYQCIAQEQITSLRIHIYVYFGLYLNIISKDLEQYYLEQCRKHCVSENIIEGLLIKEFRNVVVCGSFKHSIREIEQIIDVCNREGIKVLSPTTTKLRPETIGTDFVLFENQVLINKRDAWRHQYLHISQFAKSDAVIICNPMGKVGYSALFELGFLVAISKRVIFTEEPVDFPLRYPYEVGLDFC